MSEDILYYNYINKSFSLKKDNNVEEVLNLDVLLQWRGNTNMPPMEIGNIKIQFYPLHRRDVIIDIYVDNVQILPVSLMYRRKGYFSEHEIAFSQYGPGRYSKLPARSIFINKRLVDMDCLERVKLLIQIRDICNNFQDYIKDETTKLIEKLEESEPMSWTSLGTLIGILYKYEPLVPEIKQILCPFIDRYCFDNLKEFIEFLSRNVPRGYNYAHLIKSGDSMWQYIKDYKLLS